MNDRKIRNITICVAVAYLLMLISWHCYDPSSSFTQATPGRDNRPAGNERKADDVVIGEYFMKYDEPEPEP